MILTKIQNVCNIHTGAILITQSAMTSYICVYIIKAYFNNTKCTVSLNMAGT